MSELGVRYSPQPRRGTAAAFVCSAADAPVRHDQEARCTLT